MNLRTLITTFAIMCTISAAAKDKQTLPDAVFNRAPLVETPYAQLPLGEIKRRYR